MQNIALKINSIDHRWSAGTSKSRRFRKGNFFRLPADPGTSAWGTEDFFVGGSSAEADEHKELLII